MRLNTQEDEKFELSMGPLIDCVFLLLIFFLVTTMVKKKPRDIEVALPESASAIEVKPDDEQRVIGIDADGALFYEGEPTSVTLLHEELRSLSIESPETQIRLDTDEATPFHRVVEVLSVLQFRELNNVAVRAYHSRYDD
ncbi:MAG: ExbD/TolR family protein [Opitutales bacterium]